jgi:hypothetical protein
MTGRTSSDRGRTFGPYTRDTARPEPHKTVQRALAPRAAPELPAERASQPVKPRGGPPKPRGVR